MQEYLRNVAGWMKNVPGEVQRMKERNVRFFHPVCNSMILIEQSKTLGGPLPREVLTDPNYKDFDSSSSCFSDKSLEESLSSYSDYEISNDCAGGVAMIVPTETAVSENNPWSSSMCMNYDFDDRQQDNSISSITDRKYVREHSISL